MKKIHWNDALLTLLGVVGMALALIFFKQAFPQAAIRLKISLAGIQDLSSQVVNDLGADVSGYETAIIFDEDFLSSVYLQQTLGIRATNQLLQSEPVPVYYWYARWFVPGQQEEYSLSIAPDGTLIGFSHVIPEDAPGAALDQGSARQFAEQFLNEQDIWKMASWQPVSASSEEKPSGRVDHTFTYYREDFTAGDAQLRIKVTVQGDQVGYYDYFLKIPESFSRHFISQNNKAGFLTNISFVLGFVGLLLVSLYLMLRGLLNGGAIDKGAVVVLVSVTLISLLSSLNFLPLQKISYSTMQDYSLFWIDILTSMAISALMNGILAGILFMGGKAMSKQAWPFQDRILPRGHDRLVMLSRSTWRGLMMAGISFGYVVIFYLVAERLFGSWTPMDTDYSNLYATPFPFLASLEIGVVPAITEEFMFRLVGIGLVYWAFKKRWLALLIPGILWAFAHSSYVRDPIYLRGVELSIAAVFIYGFLFLKYDLATTIIGHFAFNAGLSAFPMLFSGTPSYMLSGGIVVAVMLAPLLPGLVVQLRRSRHGFSPPPEPVIGLIDPGQVSILQDQFLSEIAERHDAICFGLISGDRLVGVAVGSVQPGGQGRVEAVHVEPYWRRMYWGSRLVTALSAHLKDQGATTVTVEVRADARHQRTFFASLDWRPISQTLVQVLPRTFGQIISGHLSQLKSTFHKK